MYKVLQKLQITNTNKYCVCVEGNLQLLKKGVNLKDENGNIFIIQSIGMVKYKNIAFFKKYAELLLIGEVENIGENLIIVEAKR